MLLFKLFSFSILPVGLFALPQQLFSDITDFFPDVKGNLTKITWAHAVNDLAYLQKTLNDESIMMIEADIVYGKLNGKGDDIPIMGHPPAKVSDLSLENFLTTTYNFNQDSAHKLVRKGVKLDFKTIDVFEKSVDVINKLYKKIDYPIWINADIVPGPLNTTTTPVDPDRFLTNSKQFTNSVLSIGWTTSYGNQNNNTHCSYTDEQIDDMTNAINSNNITQDITFPVRAGIAAQSPTQMQMLKDRFNNSTLTIWTSDGDDIDFEQLRKVIFDYGLDRVYVDMPKELKEKLHLNSSNLLKSSAIFPILIALLTYYFW